MSSREGNGGHSDCGDSDDDDDDVHGESYGDREETISSDGSGIVLLTIRNSDEDWLWIVSMVVVLMMMVLVALVGIDSLFPLLDPRIKSSAPAFGRKSSQVERVRQVPRHALSLPPQPRPPPSRTRPTPQPLLNRLLFSSSFR